MMVASRFALALALAASAGCFSDDDSGGGGGGGDRSLLLSGMSCEGAVTHNLTGDEQITVILDSAGSFDGLIVHDGPYFSSESEEDWISYAQLYDTIMLIAFGDPQPLRAPHTVTDIFDSYFGGRDTGVLGFAEHMMGESVTINALDTTAQTIDVTFSLPVRSSTTGYPPMFGALVPCQTGLVTGGFRGTYDVLTF